jgi:HTH-type transcriptional repressor of NAD biosynthesis genes
MFLRRQRRILPKMHYEIGVVIGKFYPLHKGHQHLIETAMDNVEHLYIIICTKDEEVPGPSTRIKMIKQLYKGPNITVKHIVDIYDPNDSKLWAELTKQTIGCSPDIVFTSENYGDEYARYLKCVHELVDLNRESIPISGTLIRNNPFKHWDYLHELTREFYTIRIVFCGAESTGKTTLSSRLAKELNVAWVPEYGREYCEDFDILTKIWTIRDFEIIANTQNEKENEAAQHNKLIICDTDSLTTNVWCNRYIQQKTDFKPDYNQNTFYLFSHVEGTELIDDGTRTDSNDEIRSWMHKELLQTTTASGRPFVVLTGTYEQRYEQAKEYIVNIYKYKKIE